MKQLLLILFIICSWTNVLSQEYKTPDIIKPEARKQTYGSEIEYLFPDTVNQIISSYINRKNDSLLSYYIEIKHNDSFYLLKIYERNIFKNVDTTSISEKLLSSTNRYCIIDEKRIPIYFEIDKVFGMYNFVMTATTCIIKLRRDNYHHFSVESVSITN